MVKVLSHPEGGQIRDIIHQEEAHEEEKKNFSPESTKNKWMMIGSFLLLVVAFVGLSLFFLNKEALVLEVRPQFVPLIYTDESAFLPIDELKKENIAKSFFDRLATTEVKESGVEGFYFTEDKKVIGLRRFMDAISGTLKFDKENFIEDNFLTGLVNKDTVDPFILIKIRSHTDVFLSLRAWEEKMFSDLHGFFGIPINPKTSYLLTKDFEDGIIQNQNARILYDKEGGIVMAYIYGDNNSLIITNTESAAREVIMRLASSRIKK